MSTIIKIVAILLVIFLMVNAIKYVLDIAKGEQRRIMKLINKKTGGLANCEPIEVKTDAGFHDYYSLAELNQDWEDYAPSEPLIKDEKIRKAIRAWAEANVINPERYYNTNIKFNATEHRLQWIQTAIEFNDIMGLDNLEDGKTYTIEELCGDDEE